MRSSTPSGRIVLLLLSLVSCATAGTAAAVPVDLSTPSGLNPGDTFRFLFVTQGTTTATSSAIADYDTFVNGQAGGATYGGTTVTWKAIGSTGSVNARDHVGGFGSSVPIYLPNGTKLANDMTTGAGGLWSGSLLAAPLGYIDGTAADMFPLLFTGSESDGLAATMYYLGANAAKGGVPFVSNGLWLSAAGTYGNTSPLRMYGLSDTLSVAAAVPEIDPAGTSSVLALVGGVLAWAESRRRRSIS